MLRSAKNNLIFFRFPQEFVPQEIEDRYSIIFKRDNIPFKSVTEFLNSILVNFSFPTLTRESVEQATKVKRTYSTGLDLQRELDKTFTIDMKLTEGYLSYFMLSEIFTYWNTSADTTWLPRFVFKTLDSFGREIATLEYTYILYNEISSLDLSFTDTDPEFNRITLSFIASEMQINILNKAVI